MCYDFTGSDSRADISPIKWVKTRVRCEITCNVFFFFFTFFPCDGTVHSFDLMPHAINWFCLFVCFLQTVALKKGMHTHTHTSVHGLHGKSDSEFYLDPDMEEFKMTSPHQTGGGWSSQ